jgi:hypothetical protein
MDSVADRSTRQPAPAGVVEAAEAAADDAPAWVVDVASGRVIRRSLTSRDPIAGRSTGLN